MEAAATLVALPVACVVLWALLRSLWSGGRLVAEPTGERWHDRATPTFGGVGIAAGLGAAVALAVAVGPSSRRGSSRDPRRMRDSVRAGLVDDVRHLSPVAKLAAQFAAAGIAIACGLRVELVSNDLLGIAIALIWLVGITNAFNLLDNMDGLAATLATVACVYFAIDAATVHENDLVLGAGAVARVRRLGFLPFNLRPGDGARVFMGDAGSQLLGFLLAALGLASSWTTAGTTVATMLLPLLVLAIPILDTTLVTVRRLAERPVTQGGRDHTSHRLVYYGLSETKAVALLALIAVALGATSVAYNVLDRPAVTALGVLVTFALLVQFGSFLAELSEQERRGRPGDTRLRHAIAVQPRRLVDCSSTRRSCAGRSSSRTCSSSTGAARSSSAARFSPCCRSSWGRPTSSMSSSGSTGAPGATRPSATWPRSCSPRASRPSWPTASSSPRATWATFPVEVFWVYGLAAAVLAGASRWFVHLVPEAGGGPDDGRRRVLVVGAGPAGRGVVLDLRGDGDAHVVGFLDDNPRLRRRRVQGVPVLGTTGDARTALESTRADELVVTIPDAPADRLQLVARACDAAGVTHRVVRERPTPTRAPTRAIVE